MITAADEITITFPLSELLKVAGITWLLLIVIVFTVNVFIPWVNEKLVARRGRRYRVR